MSLKDCPECFGIVDKCGKIDRCNTCEYAESCHYCSAYNGDECNKRSGHVSYDKFSYCRDIAEEPQCYDDSSDSSSSISDNSDVRQVMEYLLDIDNYTAELLHEVLHGGCNTTSAIARKFGISRQAVHRKIVDCCTEFPELRKLFISRLYRCRRIMRHSSRLEKQKQAKINPNQQEFNF